MLKACNGAINLTKTRSSRIPWNGYRNAVSTSICSHLRLHVTTRDKSSWTFRKFRTVHIKKSQDFSQVLSFRKFSENSESRSNPCIKWQESCPKSVSISSALEFWLEYRIWRTSFSSYLESVKHSINVIIIILDSWTRIHNKLFCRFRSSSVSFLSQFTLLLWFLIIACLRIFVFWSRVIFTDTWVGTWVFSSWEMSGKNFDSWNTFALFKQKFLGVGLQIWYFRFFSDWFIKRLNTAFSLQAQSFESSLYLGIAYTIKKCYRDQYKVFVQSAAQKDLSQ